MAARDTISDPVSWRPATREAEEVAPATAREVNAPAAEAALDVLRRLVETRATDLGRTESPYPGLRYYRFTQPVAFRKTQTLMPGLVAVLQGRKVATFGERTLAYDAMHYLVLASEAVCESTVVAASPSRPYLALSLDLPPDILAKTLIAMADADGVDAVDDTSDTTLDAFTSPLDVATIDALRRLLCAVDDRTERQLLVPLVIQEITLRLLRSPAATALRGATGSARDARQVQAAMHYMRMRLAEPLSVEQVAAHVAMSPSHFAHRFRAIARVSPMRYLRELRLQQARTLLLQGARAGQAAVQVGYESASHFTRDFKGSFGLAPTDYVRRLRGR
jgi:AraC-like DNA-binding protein